MKTNKGFAPVSVILIIIGVLVVGGVVYFSKKSKNNQMPKVTNQINQPIENTTVKNITSMIPSNWKIYKDTKYLFQISYPSNWLFERSEIAKSVGFRSPDKSINYGNFIFRVATLNFSDIDLKQKDLKSVVDYFSNDLKQSPQVVNLNSSQITISDLPAYKLTYTSTSTINDNGANSKIEQNNLMIILVKNENIYILSYLTPVSDSALFSDIITNMEASFKVL